MFSHNQTPQVRKSGCKIWGKKDAWNPNCNITLTYCSLSHIPHSCHSSGSWLHGLNTKWPNPLDSFYLNRKKTMCLRADRQTTNNPINLKTCATVRKKTFIKWPENTNHTTQHCNVVKHIVKIFLSLKSLLIATWHQFSKTALLFPDATIAMFETATNEEEEGFDTI